MSCIVLRPWQETSPGRKQYRHPPGHRIAPDRSLRPRHGAEPSGGGRPVAHRRGLPRPRHGGRGGRAGRLRPLGLPARGAPGDGRLAERATAGRPPRGFTKQSLVTQRRNPLLLVVPAGNSCYGVPGSGYGRGARGDGGGADWGRGTARAGLVAPCPANGAWGAGCGRHEKICDRWFGRDGALLYTSRPNHARLSAMSRSGPSNAAGSNEVKET